MYIKTKDKANLILANMSAMDLWEPTLVVSADVSVVFWWCVAGIRFITYAENLPHFGSGINVLYSTTEIHATLYMRHKVSYYVILSQLSLQ